MHFIEHLGQMEKSSTRAKFILWENYMKNYYLFEIFQRLTLASFIVSLELSLHKKYNHTSVGQQNKKYKILKLILHVAI